MMTNIYTAAYRLTLTSVLVVTSTICERIGKWIERYTKEITKKL